MAMRVNEAPDYAPQVSDYRVLTRHFDPHVHGRRGAMRAKLLPEAAKRMCGGILEPNTLPHLYTHKDVTQYLDEVRQVAPTASWTASIYLTPRTSFDEVWCSWSAKDIGHVKGYPPHGTTHSDESVPPEMLLDENSGPGKLLCAMAEADVPFKTHGEVVVKDGRQVHPLLREGLWYREVQPRFDDLYKRRGLRQIHAHITSSEAAAYMRAHGDPDTCVAELTGHHLLWDWNALFDGGALRPDHHWLPSSKDEENTEALRQLVRDRLAYIMAGSDMAGHDTRQKYAARAFGGGYTYHCSLELYVQVLEMLKVLDFADAFLYRHARRFHGDLVPDEQTAETFELARHDWTVDERVFYGSGEEGGTMTPFGYDDDPGKRLVFRWKLVE